MARSRLDELAARVQGIVGRLQRLDSSARTDESALREAFDALRELRAARREARDDIRRLEELESALLDAGANGTAADPVALASAKLLRWVWDTVGDGDIDRWRLAEKGRELHLRSTNHLFGTQFPAMVKTGERTGRLTADGIRRARAA